MNLLLVLGPNFNSPLHKKIQSLPALFLFPGPSIPPTQMNMGSMTARDSVSHIHEIIRKVFASECESALSRSLSVLNFSTNSIGPAQNIELNLGNFRQLHFQKYSLVVKLEFQTSQSLRRGGEREKKKEGYAGHSAQPLSWMMTIGKQMPLPLRPLLHQNGLAGRLSIWVGEDNEFSSFDRSARSEKREVQPQR